MTHDPRDLSVTGADAADRRPMKGELFGATRLGSHARKLARRHTIAPTTRPGWIKRRDRGPLLSRLDATERALVAARDTLAAASAAGADVGPAGAWLLDNFFVVLEQVPEIRAMLPAGYYQELPKLAGDGPRAGYPRIYDIIVELIAHTDGRLDEPSVSLMIAEYQRVTTLTLGELWAIPAMLRMGYLENVRRMALRAARDIADRASADEWVSRLLAAEGADAIAANALSAFVHRGPRSDARVSHALPPADSQPAVRLHAAALARAVGRRRRDDGGRRGAALGAGVGTHATRDGELHRESSPRHRASTGRRSSRRRAPPRRRCAKIRPGRTRR